VPGVSRPCPCHRIQGRAYTDEEKRAVLDRLYAAWCRVSAQRLGQLLVNANGESALFYREDEVLARQVESFAKEHGKPEESAGER
jgi:hypothetical protein